MAIDLAAGDKWHLPAADEPYGSTEERDDILTQAEAEGKDVGALEKEGPLFRKEQRKSREIGAPGINLGLREVRVDRRRRQHVRSNPLRDVQARLEIPADGRGRRGHAATGRHGRTDTEAETLVEIRQSGEQTSAARLRDLVLTGRERPAIRFEQALDTPLDVEVPLAEAGLETQGLHRNRDLDAPPVREARRRRLPDAIPVGVVAFAPRVDEAVVTCAAGIHGEDIA